MKGFKITLALLLVLMFATIFVSDVAAEGDSITITIDRKVMPKTIFEPRRAKTAQETVTVYDYVIRDYRKYPLKNFITQTSSGQTLIPIDTVKAIIESQKPAHTVYTLQINQH